MNTLYTCFIIILFSLSPLSLAAGDECDCTVSKSEHGAVLYSPECNSPKDICNLILKPDLGHIELFQFVDLRDVTVRIGDGTYPSFLSSTLVSAGTYFAIDGTRVSIDIVAYGETVQRITGLDHLRLLNNTFLDLSVLACISIDIDLFGLGDALAAPCTLGDQNVFPVELLDWKAENDERGVALEWATTRERDADYYRVMHAAEGGAFREIARVPASGLSDELLVYTTTHATPTRGTNLYRLEQYDYDGTYHDLGIVSADWRSADRSSVSVWPNPVNRGGELRFSASTTEGTDARLFGPLGRLVARLDIEGQGSLRLPASLAPGKYYLQIDGVASPLLITD